ncbi:MAG: hypothetical protein WDZ94_05750 [Patescibacteria group bacterium]
MRILKSFFFLTILSILLLSSVYLVAREYFLYEGVRQFRQAVFDLERSKIGGQFADHCFERSAGTIDGEIVEYYIRFTSDTDYVLEAYCSEFAFDPQQIDQGELSAFVSKLPGSSGILFGEEPSYVQLAVFEQEIQEIETMTGWDLGVLHRSRTIGVSEYRLQEFTVVPDYTLGPATSCTGFGYKCCDRDTQLGEGELLVEGTDCDGGCYMGCVDRPTIVAVTPNPFFEPDNREILVRSGNFVDFAYVARGGGNPLSEVSIDYGDGSSDSLSDETGVFSHAYQCQAESCRYTATITAQDSAGNDSAMTLVSRIDVVVE